MNAQELYEERLADHFVRVIYPSFYGSRERIILPPQRQSNNLKIPDFKYSDAQTGSTLVLELTTLTEDDEVMQKIRNAWSFADEVERKLTGKLNGTFYCWLPIENVRDDLLDFTIANIKNNAPNIEKDNSFNPQHPIPYLLTKQDDYGQELCVFLYSSTVVALSEAKLKERLISTVQEADLKFEGYQRSKRILLIDISFCIGKDFSSFSVWDVPDKQLNLKIKKKYHRVQAIYLDKCTFMWRGDGQAIPIHGYQAGIERGRIVPELKQGLPQYQEVGYWEYPRIIYPIK